MSIRANFEEQVHCCKYVTERRKQHQRREEDDPTAPGKQSKRNSCSKLVPVEEDEQGVGVTEAGGGGT